MVMPLREQYDPTSPCLHLRAHRVQNFVGFSSSAPREFINGYSTVPFEITHNEDLVGMQTVRAGGESIPIRLYPGPTPIYLTLLTSMFMHASWMHILGNMLYLWIFGDNIEDRIGHAKFLAFYLVCGVAASAAHIMVGTDSIIPSLGASGAIAGVLGAYLVLFPRRSVRVLMGRQIVNMPAFIVLGCGTPSGIQSDQRCRRRVRRRCLYGAYRGFVAGSSSSFCSEASALRQEKSCREELKSEDDSDGAAAATLAALACGTQVA